MLNVLARILLTITALAPVGLTYSWVAYMQGSTASATYILLATFFLLLTCLAVLWRAGKSLSASRFKAKAIEAADHENTTFLLLYVMPLFTAQFNTLNWQFWIPTILIFGFITATGYNYHFNPMLSLLGWHFYKVDSEEGVKFVLITKKHLRTASTEIEVGQLTEYILLDLGGR
ncbi:hypothetical protein RADP37_05440 (plasmid) [Roseomonas mucosa]|uniref:Uncharacterized protein n=1 Tax=Roseomonas mucosa TaxID=207340 RepID=A0A4Y1MPU5_9PROT|nr:hypothetical protein RADP37_05440 [Roseomonas mucosa]